MKGLKVVLLASSLSVFAWAQAAPQSSAGNSQQVPGSNASTPATSQPGQVAKGTSGTVPQTAASAAGADKNNISGCMHESWGRYLVSDSSTNTTYNVRGAGKDLSSHADHVVQVSGWPDPKGTKDNATPFYVQQIQDTGQTCGANANASAANPTPVTGKTGNEGSAMNATNTAQPGPTPGAQTPAGMQQHTGLSANETGSAGASSTGANATPSPNPGSNGPAPNGASSTSTSPQTPNPQAQAGAPPNWESTGQSQASSSTMASAAERNEIGAPQGTLGTAGSTQSQSSAGQQAAGMENKGTPSAGTPSTAIGAPASSASTTGASGSADGGQSYQGCLSGDVNNYELKANGKTYRLQGNTASLKGLSGHQIQITGQDMNGKAIQVSSASDQGSSCSK